MAGHVFISHGSENRDEAGELCAFIESKGAKAWIAPRDVRPGIDYSEELQAAIEGCVAFVVLVTDMANKSPYVRAETEMAFSNSKPIFPVRLTDIKPAAGLAFFLKIRHWTDAYGKGREASLDRLALELQTLSGIAPVAAPPLAPVPVAAVPPMPPPAPAPAPPTRPPRAPLDAERLAAAVGPNAGWYLERWRAMEVRNSQIQWNWPACLASIFWFAYRKMWMPVAVLAIFFILLNVLALLSPGLAIASGVLSLAATVATGMLGTSLYRQHAGKLVAATAGLDREAALAELERKGGVSQGAVIVTAAIAAAIAAAFVLLVLFVLRPGESRSNFSDPFFERATSGPGDPSEDSNEAPTGTTGTTGGEAVTPAPPQTQDDTANALSQLGEALDTGSGNTAGGQQPAPDY